MAGKTEPDAKRELASEVTVNEGILNEYVSIVVPRALAKSEQTLFVQINGSVWNIPRGKPVTVPRYVALALEDQQRRQARYEEDVADSYNNPSVQYLNNLDR